MLVLLDRKCTISWLQYFKVEMLFTKFVIPVKMFSTPSKEKLPVSHFCLFSNIILLPCRLLFWTEYGVVMQLNLVDGIKVTLVTYRGEGGAIQLDCPKRRVYWLAYFRSIGHIKSCNYTGGQKKDITSGPLNRNVLGVLGDSLYFLNTSEYRINEMNVSNGNISRKILVERGGDYQVLVAVKSVQPTCE